MPPAPTPASEIVPASGISRFVRGSLGSGVVVAVRGGGALLLNKLLAVYGGPGGLTLLAHFQNLLAILTMLPNDGTHVGVVKYLAPLRPGSARYRAWLGAAVVLNCGALLLALLALSVVPGALAGVFHPTAGWFLWFGLGLMLLTAFALLNTLLLSASNLRAYVALNVAMSVLAPVAVAAVLLTGGTTTTALLAYLFGQGSMLLPALWQGQRAGLLPPLRGRVSGAAVRALSKFLLMAVGLLLFGKAVDFSVRELLVRHFGIGSTDLWQAVVKLSDNYTMVLAAAMSSVYYPRLAALATQPAKQRQWVRTVLRVAVVLAGVGLLLLYLLRTWLLPLLFEARFAAASYLLAPQLLADWFRFIAWPLVMLFTAQARVGRFVAFQAVSAGLYALALAGLLPQLGLLGAVWASVARQGLLLLWCGWYFRAYWRR